MNMNEWLSQASFGERLHQKISLYHRGIVCPAEAWNLVADEVEDASEAELACSIAPETVALFLRCQSERPESFNSVVNKRRKFRNYIEVLLYGDD
jgi:hypothetical protein